jgi:hypothetical protein
VIETHKPVPVIVDRCGEPASLAETVCQNREFQESEAEVRQALAELLPTLTDDERPLVVEELLQNRRRLSQFRANVVLQTHYNKRTADLYRGLARDEVTLFDGGMPERDHRTIKVGRYELVESWLSSEYGSLLRVLHLGTSVAIASGDIAHFERFDEADIADTHVVLVNSPEAGTDQCHPQYLLADSPGQPLRVWTLPNRRGCLGEDLEANQTDDGYVFVMQPRPSRNGAEYRWTPASGLHLTKSLIYQADGDPLYQAVQRLTGPSVEHFSRLLDFATDRGSDGDYKVTAGCEAFPSRACRYPPGYLRALKQRSTGAFYFATYDSFDERRACGEWEARRQPTADDLRGLPIEYHPPAESWPREALEVLRTSFCSKE